MIKKLAACCLYLSLGLAQNRPEPVTGNLPAQPLGGQKDLLNTCRSLPPPSKEFLSRAPSPQTSETS